MHENWKVGLLHTGLAGDIACMHCDMCTCTDPSYSLIVSCAIVYCVEMAKRLSLSLGKGAKISLSLGKGAKTESPSTSSTSRGIYFSNVSRPKGIQNAGNTCYASSVFQCLVNHGHFMNRMRHIAENHTKEECTLCNSGNNEL